MDKSWYLKGVIFLSVILGILLLIIIIYFIIRKIRKVIDSNRDVIDEADDLGLSQGDLIRQTVQDKVIEEKTYYFDYSRPIAEYDKDVVSEGNRSEDEQLILGTLIVLVLRYDQVNVLSGEIEELSGLNVEGFSYFRFHFKIEGKKRIRYRSPLRAVKPSDKEVKNAALFALSPILPEDVKSKIFRVRLYGLKSRLPSLLGSEFCLGEVNVELARHKDALLTGKTVKTDYAVLPVSPKFPDIDE